MKIKKHLDLKIWKNPQNYFIRWTNFWAIVGSGKIIFTIFFKYFLLTIICKIIKDWFFMTRLTLKFSLIFKTSEGKFKGVLIKSEGGARCFLVQDGQSAKI